MSAITYSMHRGGGGGTVAQVSYQSYPYHWMPMVVPAGATWDGAAPKQQRPASSPLFRTPSPTTSLKRPSTSLSKPRSLQRPETSESGQSGRLGTASTLLSVQPSQESLRSRSSLALSAVGNVHSKTEDNSDGAFTRTFGRQPRVGRSFSRSRSLKGIKGLAHPGMPQNSRPSTSLALTRESRERQRSRSSSPVSLTIFEYSAAP
eukprot:CAMPEP_0174933970 /NCGR_PEP_ID=MMETSP1355-20121228/47699_1 /TAXON_ID=464990 /ORGANISM="Hemiselmis tepida, Strain CCMP443" /LENGTH=204 /DNA_ID=CAMNT_0016180525 /DNA_START=85 /DNA_END=696 /DNA_ORIENTATION=-